MLFMPEKTAKEAMKKIQNDWIKEKRERDLKRQEKYLKYKKL